MKHNNNTKTKTLYRVIFSYILVSLWLTFTHCVNATINNNNRTCPAPFADGTIHELSLDCRVSNEEEHILLKDLKLPEADSKVTLWLKAFSSNPEVSEEVRGGIQIEIIGDGTIVYTNLDNEPMTNTFMKLGLDFSTSQDLCFDLHYGETMNEGSSTHVLIWQGDKCSNGNEKNADYNSENHSVSTGIPNLDNNKYLYKIEKKAEVSRIETKAPLVVEDE